MPELGPGFKVWIELGALFIAIIVAWTGLRAGKAAAKSAEAQLDAVHASVIGQAIDDYQRLGRDMSTLIDWYRECNTNPNAPDDPDVTDATPNVPDVPGDPDNFLKFYKDNRDKVDHISGARRNVRLYFQKCATLLRSGAISPRVFEGIANKKGLNILHRIVIPLEQLKLNDSESFFTENPEMQIYRTPPFLKHGDGLFTYERLGR